MSERSVGLQRRALGLGLLGAALARPAAAAADVSAVLGRGPLLPARPERAPMTALARAAGRLVAAGPRGLVLLSDDNGKTWRPARTPVRASLTAVRFANASQGWAVGHLGVILRTQDGGETWVRQMDGLAAARVMLAQAQAAARVGDATARERLKSAERNTADGADKPWLDMLVSDTDTAYVVGAYGLAMSTADAGASWVPIDGLIDNPKGAHLYRIARAGATTFIVGEQGLVLRAAAPGERFAAVASPHHGSWFSALPFGGPGLLVHGLRGRMFRSEDAGERWQAVPGHGEASINASLQLADGRALLGDQAGRLLLGDTQAKSFQPLTLPRRLAPISDLAQAANGDLVVASAAGLVVLPSGVLRA